MRLLLLAVCAAICPALSAGLHDFRRAPIKPTLFAEELEEAFADDETKEPAKKPAPPPEVEEPPPARWLGMAFWTSPYLRFTGDPPGAGAGLGSEISIHFGEQLAMTAALSMWTYSVSFREEGKWRTRDVGSIEIEVGVRLYAITWRKGAIYMDMRLALMAADGPAPVESTFSIGAGTHFGFEIGGATLRWFVEAGLGWRGALTANEMGWLDTGDENGIGGLFFDLARTGIRLYL